MRCPCDEYSKKNNNNNNNNSLIFSFQAEEVGATEVHFLKTLNSHSWQRSRDIIVRKVQHNKLCQVPIPVEKINRECPIELIIAAIPDPECNELSKSSGAPILIVSWHVCIIVCLE